MIWWHLLGIARYIAWLLLTPVLGTLAWMGLGDVLSGLLGVPWTDWFFLPLIFCQVATGILLTWATRMIPGGESRWIGVIFGLFLIAILSPFTAFVTAAMYCTEIVGNPSEECM